MKVELLKEKDLKEVQALDYKVFAQFLSKPRKYSYLKFSFSLLPEACFKAYEAGEIIGYIFARNWGTISWLGTFGVGPDYRNQGVGTRLIKESVSVLEEKEFEVIGLETMPTSSKNIGLYSKSGFRSITPTIIFSKDISDNGIEKKIEQFLDLEPDVTQFKSISESVRPGLDCSVEVKEENVFPVLFVDKYAEGTALIRPGSTSKAEDSGEFYIKNLLLSKPAELSLSRFLRSLEKLAHRRGFNTVKIAANTANQNIESILLANNYQVERMVTRMIFKGSYKQLAGFNLSRWAM